MTTTTLERPQTRTPSTTRPAIAGGVRLDVRGVDKRYGERTVLRDALARALRIAPDDYEVYLAAARMEQARGNNAAALNYLKRARAIYSRSAGLGTLTEGKPVVTDISGFGRSERDVLSLSAALEGGSSHPLAKAVLAKAAEAGAPVPPAFGTKALGGKGLTGKVGGLDVFLGSPRAAAERVEQRARWWRRVLRPVMPARS